jgi:hypothetical protein
METSDSGRFYVWHGERYRSVTSIISGGLPKPALIGWAKKVTAEYAVANLKSLEVLVADDPAGAVDWLKGAAYRDRDRKGNIGTAVHAAAEAYVLEAPYPAWPEDVAPYMRGFLQWLEDFRPTFLAVEAPVLSRTQRYAGTMDGIVDVSLPSVSRRLGLPIDRPLRVLFDIKTGSGIFPEVGLQLAAYRFGEVYIRLPDASEEPLPEVDICAAIHLKPDGYAFVPVRADEEIWKSFLFVREVYRFQDALAASIVGREIRPELEA